MHRLIALLGLIFLSACQMTRMQPDGLSAQQIAVLRENGFEPAGEDWALGLDNRLLFATDESGLHPDQAVMLDRMTKALVGIGIHGARVVGHTDSTGSQHYNERLSQQRADAVRAVLVAGGMDAQAVRAWGEGARAPIESNEDARGRAQNRRVVVIVSPSDAVPLH